MTTPPKFKVGSKIRFELAADGNPRWDFTLDRGGIGIWTFGAVTHINELRIRIQWERDGLQRNWNFPNVGDSKYDPKQWARPGFVELACLPKIKIVDMGSHYISVPIIIGD